MKKITKTTTLIQNKKEYPAVKINGNVYWFDDWTNISDIKPNDWCVLNGNSLVLIGDKLNSENTYEKIIAQKKPILDNIPVVNVDYIDFIVKEYSNKTTDISKIEGYKKALIEHKLFYTQDDIEHVFEMARHKFQGYDYSFKFKGILKSINRINVVEVDSDFNVIGCY